jgi:hypothetical protein
MARAGRTLELLVKRIESALAPQGAVIKSPDFIKDKVTGEDREVDVSIRYTVGTVPILITVECRDHQDTQNDMWLEQLATKRWKIGAARTIAVSSSGFTAPAIKDAQMQGIEVRMVDEITDEVIRSWFAVQDVRFLTHRPEVIGVHVRVYGEGSGQIPWDEEWRAKLQKDIVHAPAFERIADGRRICVNDLIREAQRASPELYLGTPRDGTRARKDLRFDFQPGMLRFLAIPGYEVKTVTLNLEVYAEVVVAPLVNLLSYSNESGAVAYTAETEAVALGEKRVVSVVRRPGSEEVVLRVEPAGERLVAVELSEK